MIGMFSSVVVSSAGSALTRWMRMRGRVRPAVVGTVTSAAGAARVTRRQRNAAEWWLSTAPSPHASVSAMASPLAERAL